MILNYFKIAWRNLLKNKVYSIVNILGLTVGLCSFFGIILIVNFELSFENFWPDKDRIYRLTSKFEIKEQGFNYNPGISAPIPIGAQKELTGFEKIVPFQATYTTVSIPKPSGKSINISGPINFNVGPKIIYTVPEYFEIFPHKWLCGSAKQALSEPNQVVLSESKLKKYFGNISPELALGQLLIYEDSIYAKVSGIVEDLPTNTDMKADEFISFSSIEIGKYRDMFYLDIWTNTNSTSQAYIKFSKNTDINKAKLSINKYVLSKIDPKDEWAKTRTIDLQPIVDQHFNLNYGSVSGRVVNMQTLYILSIVAFFLLLMAAINFINLSTVMAMERGKEIAVKKVMGGGKISIITQFLTETLLITLIAFFCSILLVQPIFTFFEKFIPNDFSFGFIRQMVPFSIFTIAFIVILSGLYPAIIAAGLNPISIFKKQYFGKSNSIQWVRHALIVFQFVVSQIFILGTIMVIRQIDFLSSKEMGFQSDQITFIHLDWQMPKEKRLLLKNKIESLAEVETASLSEMIARVGASTNSLDFQGKTIETHQKSVDSKFTQLFKLQFVAGRPLSEADTVKELVVNEAFVRASGVKTAHDIVGKLVDWWGTKGNRIKIPIVGVMKDFNFQSLHNSIKPLMLRLEPQYAQHLLMKTTKQLSTTEYQALEKKG